VKPAQIALAWVMSKPGVSAPIIGASKLYQLEDALARGDSVRGSTTSPPASSPTSPAGRLHRSRPRRRGSRRHACRGVDAILHQGALPSVPRSIKDPRPSHLANIDGTFNVLEGARAGGVKRVSTPPPAPPTATSPAFRASRP
jgi:hypothetical protein